MSVTPFRPSPGKTSAEQVVAAAQHGLIDVPIIGKPAEMHDVTVRAVLSCYCTTPNPVLVFDIQSPIVCPKCLSVYGVTSLQGTSHEPNEKGHTLSLRISWQKIGTASAVPPTA